MSPQQPRNVGGRPGVKPAPISYPTWKATECPPLELSVIQLADWIGITRARVNQYVQRGILYRVNSKIPTDHPGNKEWLLDRDGYEKNELQAPGRAPGTSPKKPPANKYALPGEESAAGNDGLDTVDWDTVLDAIAQMDLSKLSNAAVQKIQRIESAYKTRVEHQAKRGKLIDRTLVATVLGRMYQIDSDQIKPLGAKLAPAIGGMCGVEDTATLLQIEKHVDEETHRILSHIKRLMDDFLIGVGAEPVGDV